MLNKLRTILIGDIHGCLEEFEELLDKLQYNKEKDRIILLGDLVDRGKFSAEMIRKSREMGLTCVMGNHDQKVIKWFRAQGTQQEQFHQGKDYYHQFNDQDINYIAQMPLYVKIPEHNTIIVHAGLRTGIPIEKQDRQDLLYLRYCTSDKKFVSLKKIHKLGKEGSGAHFWTEFGPFGDYSVVYGHNVNSMETIRIDYYDNGTAAYGIDTGCCFGGHLSALILETKEVIQVKAQKVYYQSKFSI